MSERSGARSWSAGAGDRLRLHERSATTALLRKSRPMLTNAKIHCSAMVWLRNCDTPRDARRTLRQKPMVQSCAC